MNVWVGLSAVSFYYREFLTRGNKKDAAATAKHS